MCCPASAFLLDVALCNWGVGCGVAWPAKDDDGAEEDDGRDGESPPEESRRKTQ